MSQPRNEPERVTVQMVLYGRALLQVYALVTFPACDSFRPPQIADVPPSQEEFAMQPVVSSHRRSAHSYAVKVSSEPSATGRWLVLSRAPMSSFGVWAIPLWSEPSGLLLRYPVLGEGRAPLTHAYIFKNTWDGLGSVPTTFVWFQPNLREVEILFQSVREPRVVTWCAGTGLLLNRSLMSTPPNPIPAVRRSAPYFDTSIFLDWNHAETAGSKPWVVELSVTGSVNCGTISLPD